MQNQLNQLFNFVNKIDQPSVPLYYMLENTHDILYNNPHQLKDQFDKLTEYSEEKKFYFQ